MTTLWMKDELRGPMIDWSAFVAQYLDREGAVLDFTAPLATEAEIFEVLKHAARRYRTAGVFRDVRLFVEGCQVVQDVKGHLPIDSDPTLAAYVERLRARIGRRGFLINVLGVEQYSYPLWHRIRRCFGGLVDQESLPDAGLEVELFVGEYESTPGGIHKDGCSNFQFVFSGEKTFHVWPSDLRADAPVKQTTSAEESFLDSDTIRSWHPEQRRELVARPGQMIFCPHDWWHVAETKGLCASLTVALYPRGRAQDLYVEALREVVAQASRAGDETSMRGSFDRYSAEVARALASPELRAKLTALEAVHGTSSALRYAPPASTPGPWPEDRPFRLQEGAAIARWTAPDGSLAFAINGRVGEARHPHVAEWLFARLEGGRVESTASLVAAYEDERGDAGAARANLSRLITELAARHAFVAPSP